MKVLSLGFFLFSSLALANLRYVPINETGGNAYSRYCYDYEAVVGFAFENGNDDSIVGMYCSDEGLGSLEQYYIHINSRGGYEYDNFCRPGDFLGGVYYHDAHDDSVEGMYCRRPYRYADLRGTYYVPMYSDYRGGIDTFFCRPGAVATGLRYRNEGDDTVLGMYCSFYTDRGRR